MKTKTVDLTPTWREILPALLALLEMGETRQVALDELSRMAQAADSWNEMARTSNSMVN